MKLFGLSTRIFVIAILIFSGLITQSCVSLFLIPERMEKNELGVKIINCINHDEGYLQRQFGTPTKVNPYDNGIKMVYYEEWGHFNTRKSGNIQYYTDYRFIKFKVGPNGIVEDFHVSDGYVIEKNKNEPIQMVAFWIELFTWAAIGSALGISL